MKYFSRKVGFTDLKMTAQQDIIKRGSAIATLQVERTGNPAQREKEAADTRELVAKAGWIFTEFVNLDLINQNVKQFLKGKIVCLLSEVSLISVN